MPPTPSNPSPTNARVRRSLIEQRELLALIIAVSAATAAFGWLLTSDAYGWATGCMYVAMLGSLHVIYRAERRTNRELMDATRKFHDSVIASLDELLGDDDDDDDDEEEDKEKSN